MCPRTEAVISGIRNTLQMCLSLLSSRRRPYFRIPRVTGGGFVLSTRPRARPGRTMTIRVLVADDQSMVRAGFRMLPAGFVLKDDSGDALYLGGMHRRSGLTATRSVTGRGSEEQGEEVTIAPITASRSSSARLSQAVSSGPSRTFQSFSEVPGPVPKTPRVGLEPTSLRLTAGCSAN